MGDERNEDCEHWAEGAHHIRHVGRFPMTIDALIDAHPLHLCTCKLNTHTHGIVDGIGHRLVSLWNQEEHNITTQYSALSTMRSCACDHETGGW